MTRSFLTANDLSSEDLFAIFERARILKDAIKRRKTLDVLRNRVIGILFEKPSTRTRTSFESAILRLGGAAIYLAPGDLQIKRGEPIEDTGRMLGSYLDAVVARVYAHQTVEDLSRNSGIPVINGLSDLEHPTQAVCDLFTILEVKGKVQGLTLTYIGDGNNVCHSLLAICALAGMNMNVASPKGYAPRQDILMKANEIAKKTGARLNILDRPREATAGADILYTDVWISMGEEKEEETKLTAFQGYQINSELLEIAAEDAVVMHCLPAHRGLEITNDVIEGPQSIVWQQAENKMHGAAGILDYFLS
ncbi:MAG: ornithine carbamoyltransferase [Proteobacteria bacterium]|nr:ornithine carbamoyltransferase [Desulfobacterales bacterium]MBL6967149.1 ornithine carbamoyltransferase [Desulfobacteraceae bacterium]MBU0988672.1 ornithine carbamoyltransferase [Pseudomonadota bacterium]MBL7102584.1 ornithine carbamoyltransferase [Desulfobacteraceae bacterium]MBL7171421.1 ornithine carbamoyltransferase [Desulfobacteraceae bacterium]